MKKPDPNPGSMREIFTRAKCLQSAGSGAVAGNGSAHTTCGGEGERGALAGGAEHRGASPQHEEGRYAELQV